MNTTRYELLVEFHNLYAPSRRLTFDHDVALHAKLDELRLTRAIGFDRIQRLSWRIITELGEETIGRT